MLGTYLTVSRIFWALARDNATPFPHFFGMVNERLSCPVPAVVLCAVLCTAFGAIQLGSKTAFTDLVGSFIILTTASYLAGDRGSLIDWAEECAQRTVLDG